MHAVGLKFGHVALAMSVAFSAASPSVAKSLTVIHGFNQSVNLGGGIIASPSGTLYGVLSSGGVCGNAGCVYALSPPAEQGGRWQFSKIYQFQQKNDGFGPEGQLTLGPHGELYGYTGYGSGIIYRLKPPQGGARAWTFTKFGTLADGFIPNPASALLLSRGALFGLSTGGSQTCPYAGCGGVFEVAPGLNGGWVTSTIAAFDGGSLGGSPAGFAGPDGSGGFYVGNQYKGKVVYLVPYDSMWKAAVAASFPGSRGLGCLVTGANWDIYGVAGSFFRGRVFQIQPSDGATQWTVTTLADISDHRNAPCPDIDGPGGSLIGTVFGDQDAYYGDIFQLSPPASEGGGWTYTILAHIGQSGRYGPINAVFGLGGDLYTPVNTAYGPPSAILKLAYP
jgi:hypothetical protein